MEMRRMADEGSRGIRTSKYSLASLQILETKSTAVEWMVFELTPAIVRITVEGVDGKLEGIARRLVSDGACSNGACETASNIAPDGLVRAVHVKQFIDRR